jgi:hypothetical protein
MAGLPRSPRRGPAKRLARIGSRMQAPRGNLFAVLLGLTVACGVMALVALDHTLLVSAPGSGPSIPVPHRGGAAAVAAREAWPLRYPIWWHAPFESNSGAPRLGGACLLS